MNRRNGHDGGAVHEIGEQTTPLRRHFGKAQVVETVGLALGVVAELDPPEDLRLATFNAAFGMFGQFYDARAAAMAGLGIR